VDGFKKQMLSGNKVSLALDGWTSTNKLVITSVIAYYIDQHRTVHAVHFAFNEVDSLFFAYFE